MLTRGTINTLKRCQQEMARRAEASLSLVSPSAGGHRVSSHDLSHSLNNNNNIIYIALYLSREPGSQRFKWRS